MQDLLFFALWCLGAYLLGSLSLGDLISRAAGANIRTLGDGNPGTRNIWRQVGPRFGAMVFLADAATGAVVTLPLFVLGVPAWGVLLAVAAVLAGHIFPVFWGFRGGVGGAVGMGTTVGLLPLGMLVAAPLTAAVLLLSRTVIYAIWVFFGTVLLAGGLLHRDPVGVAAVLFAVAASTATWAYRFRVKGLADIRDWVRGHRTDNWRA